MSKDLTYELPLDELSVLEARYTIDRDGEPFVSYTLPRAAWEELGRPQTIWVTVSTERPTVSTPAVVNASGKTVLETSALPGPWTEHGHTIPGVTVAGPKPAGLRLVRCGGLKLCKDCKREAERYTKAAETGEVRGG